MKKYLVLYKILFLSLPGFAQVTVSPGTALVTSGAVTINMENMSLVNNGTFAAGTGKVKFTGNSNNNLGGTSVTTFNVLEIAKESANSLLLTSNISINGNINFTSGLIDLNQKTISLGNNALLNNENESSRIVGPNGGEVTISLNLNKPNNANPGNLGASLTSSSNLGTVVIKRGHSSQSGSGLSAGIHRYYNIQVSAKKVKATTVRLGYFDAELNGQNENEIVFYQSLDNGANWSNQSFSSRDASANWVEKTAMMSFGLLTLSYDAGAPPITNRENIITEMPVAAAKKITVGPNPNNGNFWFIVSGLQKETSATLYSIDGKPLKQFRVTNQQQQQVNGLSNGIYLLKVEGMNAVKVMVQGSGNTTNTNSTNNYSPKY